MKSGFSILELMVVLTILCGIVAISWPALTKKIKTSEDKIFNQKIKETIENTRYLAIKTGKSFGIKIKNKKISVIEVNNIDEQNITLWVRADGICSGL